MMTLMIVQGIMVWFVWCAMWATILNKVKNENTSLILGLIFMLILPIVAVINLIIDFK